MYIRDNINATNPGNEPKKVNHFQLPFIPSKINDAMKKPYN